MILAAIAHFGPMILHALTHESTDDAYVQASIVPVSAEVSGKVDAVFVNDNARVAAGDSLVRIDAADYELTVMEKVAALEAARTEQRTAEAAISEQEKARARARADLVAAEAKADLAERERVREQQLLDGGAASQSQYDQARAAAHVATAAEAAARAAVAQAEANLASLPDAVERARFHVRSAQAALDNARLDLQRTVVRAPVSGQIARKNVDPGKYVAPGQPILAIVDTEDPWIVANFKETQIRKMRPAQPVEIRVDAYPGVVFRGRIDSLQPGTGAVFSLLPPENATGNFVKVTQRIPVKILVDSPPDAAHPLYPGLSVRVSVDVRSKDGTTGG